MIRRKPQLWLARSILPEALHLDKGERCRPGDEHEARKRLGPGQEAYRSGRNHISETECREAHRRVVDAIEQAQWVLRNQRSVSFRGNEKVVSESENPDLQDVRK